MNWTNLGYTANESIAIREDFKVIRIGKDFESIGFEKAKELKAVDYCDLRVMCIRAFNESALQSSSENEY